MASREYGIVALRRVEPLVPSKSQRQHFQDTGTAQLATQTGGQRQVLEQETCMRGSAHGEESMGQMA
jgi:hypothetical protein